MTPDFTKRFINLKNLFRELKTAGNIKPILSMHTFRVANTDPSKRYIVTYAEGEEPILTEYYREWGDVLAATPVGNTQYIFINSQAYGEMTAISTRPIVSIVAG